MESVVIRETVCCRKDGHVTLCPVLRAYADGSFSISDDHGGMVKLTRSELLEVTKACATALLEKGE